MHLEVTYTAVQCRLSDTLTAQVFGSHTNSLQLTKFAVEVANNVLCKLFFNHSPKLHSPLRTCTHRVASQLVLYLHWQ